MHKKIAAICSVAAVAAATLIGVAAPASALSPGVAFSAVALPTWQTNGIAWAMTEADGVMYVGGTFTQVRPPGTAAGNSQSRAAVNFAAFDASTGTPTSCALSFSGGTGATVRAMDVSPDGRKLYVGGNFTTVNGVTANRLAAINLPGCTVDTTFRPGTVNSTVRTIAATANAVYFGGDFTTVNGTSRSRFAAVGPTGSLLPWAPVADGVGRALDVPAGRDVVLISGDFSNVNGTPSRAMAVVDNGTGANVRTYPAAEYVPASAVVKDVTSDGTSFYIAGEGMGGRSFDGRARLSLDNNYEQIWKDTCQGATQAVLPYKDVLYSGHHVHDCSAMGGFADGTRKHLSAQDIDNPYPFLGWSPDTNDGTGEGLGPRALEITSTGRDDVLWVAGEFTTTNGTAQQGLTRFGPGPASAAPGTPANVSAVSFAAGQNQVRWTQSVDNDDSALTYSVYRNGSSTALGTVTGNSTWFNTPQLSFTDTTATPGTAYTYRVRASDGTSTSALSGQVSVTTAAATQPYPAAVLGDGASTYWRLDDSTAKAPADSSPGNNRGVTFGGPLLAGTAGAVPGSTAAVFDGVDDQVSGQQRYSAPTTYSAEAWFKTDSVQGGKIFGFASGQPDRHGTRNSSGTVDRHLYMTTGGTLAFGVLDAANTPVAVTTAQAYNDNAWHHAVATQTASGFTLYVDGNAVGSSQTPAAQTYTGSWRVGGDSLNNWPGRPTSNYLAGSIDEFSAYPSALSAAQVARHFTAGGGTPGQPEPAPDTAAPAAVTGAAAAVSNSTATLSWQAATDNVGVTGYRVYRSVEEGFTPSAANLLTTTGGSVLSVSDANLAPGTYYYRVAAVDAAGNAGAASAQVNATVAGAPPAEPVTLSLSPTADTYVNQGAPNGVHGSAVSMASRGSLAYTSYLRFAPGTTVPAGMRLTSATLRVYTTSESFSNSTDQHSVQPVTGSWTEAATTYNTRPALGTSVLGSISPTATNTAYTVDLDPAAVTAMLSGSIDLGITSAGTDNAWFHTKEASSTRRPVLTLVFGP
ncbi:DNRLRE domain-containing protein [Arthrobacter sp. zg-Y1219]|uniref:CBM96 family carbohydrate-binding protein n=1 Tax=Arthrobacter sp. zg-Y1219 TaxID=3049067 RepID=UPI0024C2D5B6|nr:LamG-like jellyroll fold domain-containing protein [Arthrobacter sp. zg-Y1219]MDK1360173.1 DNRLRE domain-containing protein [Arthrobacter sp. zg-Y1219]